MLKRIYADNFRALVNFEFQPKQLSLLLGENGSGKTSVFDVLGKLRDAIVLGAPVAALFSHTRTRWDSRELQRFELSIEVGGETFTYALDVQHPPEATAKPFVKSEAISLEGTPLFRFTGGDVHLYLDDQEAPSVFPYSSDRSYLVNIDSLNVRRMGRLAKFKRAIEGLWILQPNPFASEWFTKEGASFLARNGENFASYFNDLNSERPAVRDEFEHLLREVLPGFKRFSLPRRGDQKLLIGAFEVSGKEANMTLGELSEGQRVLVMLYAAVLGLATEGATVCFDEPDNFVSLGEIQPWLQLLRDTVEERGSQAMVISHHPEVMDYLALDSVWFFERPTSAVRVTRHKPDLSPGQVVPRLPEIVVRGA